MEQQAFLSYESYKGTDLPWLESIPSHWELVRKKYIFKERVQKGFPDEPRLAATQSQGVVRKTDYEARTVEASKDFHLLKLVKQGDFVISLRSFEGGIEFAYHQGIISPAYTVLTPRSTSEARYHRHLLKSQPFIQGLRLFVTGIREGQNIDYTKLSRSALPCPPADECERIANFLDQKTAEIDEAIAKKQRLIELLKEQKAILINQATSKGERVRLRYLVKGIEQGWSPNTDNRVPDADSWGVLTAGCVNGGIYSDAAFKVLPKSVKPKPELEVKVGDILMSRASGSIDLIGSAGLVRTTRSRLMFSDKVFRVTTNARITPQYFVYAVGSINARQQIKLMISGAGGLANNLGISNIKNIVLNVPNIQEQVKIASKVDAWSSESGVVIGEILRQIKTLEEFRLVVVSDAVTGKIKL